MGRMTDSLENRLERLSPEHRRSVEDYIDFLLACAARGTGTSPRTSQDLSPQIVAPPPFFPTPDIPPADPPLTENLPDIPQTKTDHPIDAVEPKTLRIQEIATEKEDSLSQGYMDYGKFEPPQKSPPSPADEAVRRVKIKLDGKKEKDPARNVLDWID